MRRSALLLVTALTALGACSEPTSPEIPGRYEILPPASYAEWWTRVEACSGKRGAISRVRWYTVSSFPDRPDLLGQWNSNHEITLRDDVRDLEPVVSHEILHELLDGDRDHLELAWTTCGLPRGNGG